MLIKFKNKSRASIGQVYWLELLWRWRLEELWFKAILNKKFARRHFNP
jgi:hypothetical protein